VDVCLERYELFGWDYPYLNPLADKEIAWYTKSAQRTGGPVLELACGTARLLTAIARAGYTVEGIDLSPNMINMAGERVSGMPSEVASRIFLHRADMTDFQLDRHFGLVIIADNSFRELKTRKQQLSCLKCVHRHLRPGGKLLVAVRRSETPGFGGDQQMPEWSEPVSHPVTHDSVERKVVSELSQDGKWAVTVYYYKTTHKDGSETVEKFVSEAPVMSMDDYSSLFSEAGFSANAFVDYEEQADDGKSLIICFVCDRLP